MANPPKRRALGRGLSALMPQSGGDDPAPSGPRQFFLSPVEQIYPDPAQPRRHFAETELSELADSIGVHGVIQPLIVRQRTEGGYTLIAGERRWRAAQRAGLREVPVVVQDIDEAQAFERALVENVQRADLNPIEEAMAYDRLARDFGHTQEQIAERVGKSRSSIANTMRLLKLPARVREMVEEGSLSMGHAKALLALESEGEIVGCAKQIASAGLSVRAAESLIAKSKDDKPATKPASKSPSVRDLEDRLTKSLGAQCQVKPGKTGKTGTIQIRYRSLDDLDRLLSKFTDL